MQLRLQSMRLQPQQLRLQSKQLQLRLQPQQISTIQRFFSKLSMLVQKDPKGRFKRKYDYDIRSTKFEE